MIKFIMTTAMVLMLTAPASAEWTYKASRDAFDDTQESYSIFAAGEMSSLLRNIPKIAFICNNTNSTSPVLVISPGPFLGGGRATTVKLRVDDFPTLNFLGVLLKGDDYGILISDINATLIRNMRIGRLLRIRAHDHQRNSHDATFTLSGFTAAINKIADQCEMPRGWNEPEAPSPPAKEN